MQYNEILAAMQHFLHIFPNESRGDPKEYRLNHGTCWLPKVIAYQDMAKQLRRVEVATSAKPVGCQAWHGYSPVREQIHAQLKRILRQGIMCYSMVVRAWKRCVKVLITVGIPLTQPTNMTAGACLFQFIDPLWRL